MFRLPESKTVFWRSSWCGGRGCWWCSSRIRFIGTSLPFGGEESPLTALLQRGQEPSGRLVRPVFRSLKERRAGPIARVPIVSRLEWHVNNKAASQVAKERSLTPLFTEVPRRGILGTSP